jgi:Coenzyme PQQ synthesis protein D (PqqD)
MTIGEHGLAVGRPKKPAAYPKRRERVAAQIADGEAVLLDIESGEYFALNPVGSRIWELSDGTRSTGEIVSVICGEFDVAEDIAMADVREILDELEKEKLVVRA